MKSITCFFCGTNVNVDEKISRNDDCPKCKSYLKCCRNCKNFDERMYNSCLETSAERQVDKKTGNFCEYFCPQTKNKIEDEKLKLEQAQKALESLFKK